MTATALPHEVDGPQITCSCGYVLSGQVAGLSVIRVRTRRSGVIEWTGFAVSIRCPECRRIWTNPRANLPAA